MIINYVGVKEINGSLIVMDGVKGVSNEEIVDIRLENGTTRQGRVVQIEGERIVVQVLRAQEESALRTQELLLRDVRWKCRFRPKLSDVCLTVQADRLTDSAIFSP